MILVSSLTLYQDIAREEWAVATQLITFPDAPDTAVIAAGLPVNSGGR